MQKDIAKKKLQEHPDVFADIFNNLVFFGREFVNPSELTLIPTASRHSDAKGELRERTRDILMQDNRSGVLYLLLGLGNQDYIDNTMPLRCMGYDFAAYDKQVKDYMDENRQKGNSAYLRKIHKEQKLAPVITLVTYYGQEEWDAPKDIYEMLNMPDEWKQGENTFIHNYPMNFVHMGKLPGEVRERFTSDVRLLVEYLACRDDLEKLKKLTMDMNQKISHPEDLLDAYYGQEEWDAPKDIYEMLNMPDEWKQGENTFIHNYPMNFVHMGKLPDEVRERFTSDVRLLVEYLACRDDLEKLKKLTKDMNQKISHPEDLLDALSTVADKRYLEIKDVIINKPEKEELTMCVLVDELEKTGKAKGKAEDIIDLLEECDTVPEWLKNHIMQETDVDKLKALLKLSAKVESIEEFIKKSGMK